MVASTKRLLISLGASFALVSVLFVAGPLGAAAARASKPAIKSEKVGYYGNATDTYQVTVIVYSNLGPRAGNHVTVCLKGLCEKAHGHNARTPWYSASFRTDELNMGDLLTFTVLASDAAGHTKKTVTKDLLCMGSAP